MEFGSKDPVAGILCWGVGNGPLATSSSQAQEVPTCNHRFSEATNIQVLTKAFFWVFAYDDSSPQPTGAPKLCK